MADRPQLIRVWDDSVSKLPSQCRAEDCQRRIWWARTVANNKAIAFSQVPVAVRREQDPESGREIRFVDYTAVHWSTCPGAARFRSAR